MKSLKEVRIFEDINKEDEIILRQLFRNFKPSWTLFQKHSKLKDKYSVQRLKTIKLKLDKVEALWSNHALQKAIHSKYKEFRKTEGGQYTTRDEELKGFQNLTQNEFEAVDKFTLKVYMNSRYPATDWKQSKRGTTDEEKAPTEVPEAGETPDIQIVSTIVEQPVMKEGGNMCSLNSIQDTQNYLTAEAYKTFDPNENSILGTPHGAQPVREFVNEAELSHYEFHSIREDPNPLHQNFLTQIDEEPLGATPISQSQLLIPQQPKRQSNSSDKSFRSMLSNCVMERESLKSSKRHSYDL